MYYSTTVRKELGLHSAAEEIGFVLPGHCHGLQACQAIADVGTFGEPCPEQGSYLSVEYHCKDGMIRSMVFMVIYFIIHLCKYITIMLGFGLKTNFRCND